MLTRARTGIFKPNPRYALSSTYVTPASSSTGDISPLPSSVRVALRDPNWRAAMESEYNALMSNRTWRLVDRPLRAHTISGKWVFTHKLKPDGPLDRYKARWIVRGFTQRAGVDFGETFTPVVKPATIHTVLTIAASKRWPTHQLDVSNAFLHGTLREQVFCQQPTGFVDPARPNTVCLLDKSLYGLRQAPRAWFDRFATFAISLGFTPTRSDSLLFVLRRGQDVAYLLLYVDDMVLTGSSQAVLQQIVDKLRAEFAIKDLGKLRFFLGIEVRRTPTGFFLSQQRYAEDVLDRAGMVNCKPALTPIDAKGKLSADGQKIDEASSYRSLAGALQYLTVTRPDLAFAVQQVCLHMHDPRVPHQALMKRILKYVRGTSHLGLHICGSQDLSITAYSDADWAGCPDTRRSTSGSPGQAPKRSTVQ
jgi:hypothetical protein